MLGRLGSLWEKRKAYMPWVEVVGVIYSYLVIVDYGFALEEFHDLKRSLKELDKILAQLPYGMAGELLQAAVDDFCANHGRAPRLPKDLIEFYELKNAEPFRTAEPGT